MLLNQEISSQSDLILHFDIQQQSLILGTLKYLKYLFIKKPKIKGIKNTKIDEVKKIKYNLKLKIDVSSKNT